jgi:hypothetical protein
MDRESGGIEMSKLREAAQAVVSIVTWRVDDVPPHLEFLKEMVKAVKNLKDALAEDALAEMQAVMAAESLSEMAVALERLSDALAEEPIVGEQEFTFREPGVKIWEQQMALTPFAEQELHAAGWRRCAEGQGETQHCGMLEAAVLAEREACAKLETEAGVYTKSDLANAIRARGKE